MNKSEGGNLGILSKTIFKKNTNGLIIKINCCNF